MSRSGRDVFTSEVSGIVVYHVKGNGDEIDSPEAIYNSLTFFFEVLFI